MARPGVPQCFKVVYDAPEVCTRCEMWCDDEPEYVGWRPYHRYCAALLREQFGEVGEVKAECQPR